MMLLPWRSSARALASTSNADSEPSRDMRAASFMRRSYTAVARGPEPHSFAAACSNVRKSRSSVHCSRALSLEARRDAHGPLGVDPGDELAHAAARVHGRTLDHRLAPATNACSRLSRAIDLSCK